MLKLGVKALNNASREVVVKLLKRQGAELVKRETARSRRFYRNHFGSNCYRHPLRMSSR